MRDSIGCKPDSSGANWFMCPRGTVGCPIMHDGLTPHCIACTAGEPCEWEHDPPGLEMTVEAYERWRESGTKSATMGGVRGGRS